LQNSPFFTIQQNKTKQIIGHAMRIGAPGDELPALQA
jgi:hypothetical protein